MKVQRKDLILSTVIGLAFVIFVVTSNADRGYTLVHRLCDGTFTAAALLIGAGGLIHCANKGFFNILGYGAKRAISLIIPVMSNPWDNVRDGYFEYCQGQAEKPAKPCAHLLIVGCVYLVVSAVLLVVYMTMQ